MSAETNPVLAVQGSGVGEGASYPELAGRPVFITGGGSGIGASLVEGFARQGAPVAFVDIDEAASRALVERLQAQGLASPWWRRVDVTDVDALRQAVQEGASALGDFHTLVNNVGSDDRHRLEEVTPDYWNQRVAINQRAASPAFTGQLDCWIYFQWHIVTLPAAGADICTLIGPGIGVDVNSAGTLRIGGSVNSARTTDALSTGTTYHIRIHYVADQDGGAASAVFSVEFSTTSTFIA